MPVSVGLQGSVAAEDQHHGDNQDPEQVPGPGELLTEDEVHSLDGAAFYKNQIESTLYYKPTTLLNYSTNLP